MIFKPNLKQPIDSQIMTSIDGLPPVPNSSLITIAGRSGHGKTFFAMYLMDKLIDAMPGKQCLYFNLEMPETIMLERHATLLGYNGSTRKELIKRAFPDLITKNVSLVSVPLIPIEEIETQAHLASLRQPLNVIVVDYLECVRIKDKNIERTNIPERLAALSLELNCIVIVLIQTKLDVVNRPIGERCPLITDADESLMQMNLLILLTLLVGGSASINPNLKQMRTFIQIYFKLNAGKIRVRVGYLI